MPKDEVVTVAVSKRRKSAWLAKAKAAGMTLNEMMLHAATVYDGPALSRDPSPRHWRRRVLRRQMMQATSTVDR